MGWLRKTISRDGMVGICVAIAEQRLCYREDTMSEK